MKLATLQAANVGGSPNDIEATFYETLHKVDIEQMMSCRADEDGVVCIHPRVGRVTGLTAIRSSFETMFNNGCKRAFQEQVHKTLPLTNAVHQFVEKIDFYTPQGIRQDVVIAINDNHTILQGWRMVAQLVRPGTIRETQDMGSMSTALH